MVDVFLVVLGTGATIALLACSAFFSSSETAIFSLPRAWVDERAAGGGGGAAALKALVDDPHRLLVTLLVGNNIVNVAISSIVTVILAGVLDPGSTVVAATAVTSLVVVVFGEIIPKSFGLGNARRWALFVARPIQIVEAGLSPIVTALDYLTRRMSAALGSEPAIETPYLD